MNNLSDVASKLKGKAVAAASSFKRRFAALGKEIWKRKIAYLFIAPLIIGLLIFSYYPPVYGLALSFFEKHSVGETVFVGFANYANLFKDDVFLRSIPTMFYIMIPRLLIGIVVPLVMAELIFSVKSEKLQGLYRVLVLVPIVAPGVCCVREACRKQLRLSIVCGRRQKPAPRSRRRRAIPKRSATVPSGWISKNWMC